MDWNRLVYLYLKKLLLGIDIFRYLIGYAIGRTCQKELVPSRGKNDVRVHKTRLRSLTRSDDHPVNFIRGSPPRDSAQCNLHYWFRNGPDYLAFRWLDAGVEWLARWTPD